MTNITKTAVPVLAAAITLACGGAVAQEDPVDSPDDPTPGEVRSPQPDPEAWQPDAEPVRPEQVEETIDEVLDPDFDPSRPRQDEIDPVDTDRIDSGPPTDNRMTNERLDSTLEAAPGVDDRSEFEEAAEE